VSLINDNDKFRNKTTDKHPDTDILSGQNIRPVKMLIPGCTHEHGFPGPGAVDIVNFNAGA
jgi:hypothetical protein